MQKLTALLQSRKFWALITALVSTILAVIYGNMPISQAIMASIAALSAYMIGTGLDNGTYPAPDPAPQGEPEKMGSRFSKG